jgi:hypothetical protein
VWTLHTAEPEQIGCDLGETLDAHPRSPRRFTIETFRWNGIGHSSDFTRKFPWLLSWHRERLKGRTPFWNERRQVKKVRLLGAAALAVLMVFPGMVGATAQTSARADETVISESAEQHLREFWSRYSVPATTQDALIKRLAGGHQIDSTRAGTAPVSTETTETEGLHQTVDRFSDGSVAVSSISRPATSAPFGVLTVENCRSSESGSGFVNRYDCQAASQNGVVTLGFYISYTTTNRYDSIIEVGSAYRHCSIGTCDTPKLAIRKKVENSTGSAWANVTTIHTNINGNGSTKYELRALVGENRAWTRWELP